MEKKVARQARSGEKERHEDEGSLEKRLEERRGEVRWGRDDARSLMSAADLDQMETLQTAN